MKKLHSRALFFLSEFQYQKMNFSPFTTQFASAIPANAVNQFTAAKFTQNITTANGQVSPANLEQ